MIKFSEGFPPVGFEDEILGLMCKMVARHNQVKGKGSLVVSKCERELRKLCSINYNGSSNSKGGRDRGNLMLKLK